MTNVTVYPSVDPTPAPKRKRKGPRYPNHIGKQALIDVIIAGYSVGVGPTAVGMLTGYSERQVRIYASEMGLSFGQGVHSSIPNPVPVELMLALMKAGCGNYPLTRRKE